MFGPSSTDDANFLASLSDKPKTKPKQDPKPAAPVAKNAKKKSIFDADSDEEDDFIFKPASSSASKPSVIKSSSNLFGDDDDDEDEPITRTSKGPATPSRKGLFATESKAVTEQLLIDCSAVCVTVLSNLQRAD